MSPIDPASIVVGIILTYGIGLLPAWIPRFAIFKRPLSNGISFLICCVWFIIWMAFILSLRMSAGQEPRLSGGSFVMDSHLVRRSRRYGKGVRYIFE